MEEPALRLVIILAFALAVAGIAAMPAASACTGDPSVCGTVNDVKCTMREKTEALGDCFGYVGPPI